MVSYSKKLHNFKENVYVKKIIFFGQNSGLHGFRYIAQDNANFFTRLLWTIAIATSAWCTYMLLLPVVLRGSEVNFSLDTLYLSWTTTFPAVTLCEKYSHTKTLRRFNEYYPELLEPLDYTRKRYLSDLLFVKGACSKCEPCGEKIPCNLRWREIAHKVRKNCEEMVSDCAYNGISFKCCDRFFIVDSEEGPCYSINTLQSTRSSEVDQLVMNITTGPGVLTFTPFVDMKISVHSSEELSTNALDPTFKFEASAVEKTEFIFSIAEVQNDPLLQRESLDVRGCRYLHEIPFEPLMEAYPVYSYGACTLARETYTRYVHCGCIHPVRSMAYENKFCNFTGLNCLVQYEAQITKLSGPVTNDNVVQKALCLPACGESELKMVHLSNFRIMNPVDESASVTIRSSSLPTLRYCRNVLRNDLDLVVTVGGMVGLFFGASILSLAEIFYLMLRK